MLDNSVVLAWCFEDEDTIYADYVLDQLNDDTAIVPGIWPLELTNALRTGERRQRLRAADTARFSEIIRWLPITVEQVRLDRSLGDVLDVARNYDLTSYDASYLELAMREGIPLATQDARLTAAATRAGVPILD